MQWQARLVQRFEGLGNHTVANLALGEIFHASMSFFGFLVRLLLDGWAGTSKVEVGHIPYGD